jgi:hypothetical protein
MQTPENHPKERIQHFCSVWEVSCRTFLDWINFNLSGLCAVNVFAVIMCPGNPNTCDLTL